jgi:cyclic pyranopterin monophosphate synthase
MPDTAPLTHLDEKGAARMVDVSAKGVTTRKALARAKITMSPSARTALIEGNSKKGDGLGVARIAGIMAAKRTHDLIPLCHPLALDAVHIDIETAENGFVVSASVTTTGRTGVEMEALTAACVAALTLYDMTKAIDRAMVIGPVELVQKSGGRSGDYQAGEPQ